jgi:hypothetical protein
MPKTFKQFERVPVEVVEKILEQQSHFAKGDPDPKPVSRKARRAARGLHLLPKRTEVLTP